MSPDVTIVLLRLVLAATNAWVMVTVFQPRQKKIQASKMVDPFLRVVFWHAPLGVRSSKRRRQSLQSVVVYESYRLLRSGRGSLTSVLLYSLEPHYTRTFRWSPPVVQGRGRQGPPSIWFVQHSCNVPKQGEMPWLDYCREMGLHVFA